MVNGNLLSYHIKTDKYFLIHWPIIGSFEILFTQWILHWNFIYFSDKREHPKFGKT